MIELHNFLLDYAWELLVTTTSIAVVCSGISYWIQRRDEQITKNWKGAIDANS